MEKIRKIGITNVARATGMSHAMIVNWFARGQVPAEQVLRVVRATNGEITPHDLRPDIYPDEHWMPPGIPNDEYVETPKSTRKPHPYRHRQKHARQEVAQ